MAKKKRSDRFAEVFLTDGRGVLLAYDQGLEHGPADFKGSNADPAFIVDLAVRGKFNGLVLQKGLAEKYYNGEVPLVMKINGKTSLPGGDPLARQNCSVKRAKDLGASAIGYTIYPGSANESVMFEEFGRIQEEAKKRGLAVVAWVYPRGSSIKNDTSSEIVAYAARIGLELGADVVKIKYSGDPESFKWAVKCAGKAKVFMSGGPKAPTNLAFLRQVRGVLDAGAAGVAVGRNVWQNENPLEMARALRRLVIDDRQIDDRTGGRLQEEKRP